MKFSKLFDMAKIIKDLKKENRRLHKLCKLKDSYFSELISDGLRHGSTLAARHMADRNKYLKGL